MQPCNDIRDAKDVKIDYVVSSLEDVSFEESSFDVISLIFAHFPGAGRINQFQRMEQWLKPGGKVIIEVFSKNHLKYVNLNPKVGGPKEESMLFSKDELIEAFPSVIWEYLNEEEVELNEGAFHQGVGMVIRAVGNKK